MSLRDVLRLIRGDHTLGLHPLHDRPVEVGSASGCDLSIPSRAVAPRALLLCPAHGSVFAYDLAEAPGLGTRRPMPLGKAIRLGDGYELIREKAEVAPPGDPSTAALPWASVPCMELELVGEAASRSAAVRVLDAPVSIGSAPDNAVSLDDPAVSRYHCRLEPSARGLSVRDLGSTNGTWVDGARAQRVDLRIGSSVRLGRSTLRLVEAHRNASDGVVARSEPMRRVLSRVDRVASLPWPVLVCGETGVGKELIAHALHRRGRRRARPFVALNMGGLPRELVESELFGHERGAFTGAVRSRRGAFEQANGGTLFLDEIGELALPLQTRLLRVLDTHRVRRLGSESERDADVRVVCATHTNLREAVQAGAFREDLFYRIHRLVIDVPPLRKRTADILPLCEHLLASMRAQAGIVELDRGALERLCAHRWPGNVRELRNVLEVAVLENHGGVVDQGAIERALRRTSDHGAHVLSSEAVREALTHYGGNVSATARALGVPRSTLRDRLKAYGIER